MEIPALDDSPKQPEPPGPSNPARHTVGNTQTGSNHRLTPEEPFLNMQQTSTVNMDQGSSPSTGEGH